MGYLRHEAVIVSGWNAEHVLQAHAAASSIFNQEGMGALVGGLTHHAINGGAAFLISPDGSKEGWEQSEVGKQLRQEFIAYLKGTLARDLWLDWCLVLVGGDDGEYRVLDSVNGPEEKRTTIAEASTPNPDQS